MRRKEWSRVKPSYLHWSVAFWSTPYGTILTRLSPVGDPWMKPLRLPQGFYLSTSSIRTDFALDKRTRFSSYQIASIRFELYNLYKTVKDRHSQRYNVLIEFLIEFNEHFPTIIPEKLYLRVLTSLKALVSFLELSSLHIADSLIFLALLAVKSIFMNVWDRMISRRQLVSSKSISRWTPPMLQMTK